jgi:DNA-binding transcriptional regulator YiaG
MSSPRLRIAAPVFTIGAPDRLEAERPRPAVIRAARVAAGLTQTAAAQTVQASLRGWQQWEAGDRAMPPGLFELFMLKTGQWPLKSDSDNQR